MSNQPQFLGQKELAARWGISPRTLERWRMIGHGPRFVKVGAHVVYRLSDVQAYEAERVRTSTRPHDEGSASGGGA